MLLNIVLIESKRWFKFKGTVVLSLILKKHLLALIHNTTGKHGYSDSQWFKKKKNT